MGKQLGLKPVFSTPARQPDPRRQRPALECSALYVTPSAPNRWISQLLEDRFFATVPSAGDLKPQRPEDLCGKRVGSIKASGAS